MPTPRDAARGVSVAGKLYVLGGQIEGNRVIHAVEEYDPQTDRWARKSDMPTARIDFGLVTVDGGIYLVGGQIRQFVDDVIPFIEKYDPSTDQWTQLGDMPSPRIEFSTTTVNGRIFAIGGVSSLHPAGHERAGWPDIGTVTGLVDELDLGIANLGVDAQNRALRIWGGIKAR